MKKGENKRERNLDRDGAVGVEAAAVHVAAAVQPRGARLLRVVRVVVLRLCADPAVKKKTRELHTNRPTCRQRGYAPMNSMAPQSLMTSSPSKCCFT
jgi:hypothetical protein